MSIVLSHPTGNQFFKAAAKGFYDAGLLQSIYTSLASFPGTWLYKLGSLKFLNDIKRRSLDKNYQSITHTHPFKEAGRLLSTKLNQQKLIQHEKGFFSVDAVYKNLDKYVAAKLKKEHSSGANTMYAYEDGAAYSFKQAAQLNITCVYDLPIGYWRTMHNMLAIEKEANPEWSFTLEGLKDSAEKLARKDEEIALANTIIVASSFTHSSLNSYKGTLPEIKCIPYGFPSVYNRTYRRINGDKIKLLFVGGLSQRKGLSYLFKAVEGFEAAVSLTIIGRSNNNYSKVLADNLAKHTWIQTMSHNEVLEQMRAHDVLIFPSLFEGFGQVITEAMAQGSPVITTERTAGPDVIQHNKNGWLVKAASVDAIKNVLHEIMSHPNVIETMGKAAAETAAQRPWKKYSEELCDAVMNSSKIIK